MVSNIDPFHIHPSKDNFFLPVKMLAEDIDDLKKLIVGRLVSETLFDLALTKSAQTGVSVDGLLLQEGLMNEERYFQSLSDAIGVTYLPPHHASKLQLEPADLQKINQRFSWSVYLTDDGFAIVPLDPRCMGPQKTLNLIKKFIKENSTSHPHVRDAKFYIVSSTTVRNAFESRFSKALLFYASETLAKNNPEYSAKEGVSLFQSIGLFSLLGASLYSLWLSPQLAILTLSSCFSIFFFALILFRLITAFQFRSVSEKFSPIQDPLIRNHPVLPVYTLLVPLFRETSVLPQLIAALEELDYPKAKLDIKLLLEEIDTETIKAVQALNLPPYFHIVVVPNGQPRTKPKALNYGLQLAQGDYVVIYDAEDIPAPDQLRRALAAFENHPTHCAVVQAKLNFYNWKQNWLTKQFTMEYSSLFDGLLPAYFKFSIPLPLGGTSNHFRKDILLSIGAWDPYNVTEDADLGMRLYRHGYCVTLLGSTTYEEACSRFSSWLFQRTRWLKGWMQTYYVHMRRPFKLWRVLGTWKFLGFQLVVGAPIISALVHPLFLVLLFWTVFCSETAQYFEIWPLWGLSLFNLSFGYFATMWLGAQALKFRNLSGFLLTILTLPIYWLMISLATYRALFQLVHAPFYWEKTDHSGQTPKSS